MSLEPVYVDEELFLGRVEEQQTFREALGRVLLSPAAGAPPAVFLVYGEGGMGKSRLLRRFRDIAKIEAPYEGGFQVLLVDWELERTRHLGLQVPREKITADTVLAALAAAVDRAGWQAAVKPFREVARRRREVETEVRESFEQARNEDRWAALRGVASQTIATVLCSHGALEEPLQEPAKAVIDRSLELSGEQVSRVVEWFRTRSRLKAADEALFRNPEEELARALGRGLAAVAKSSPSVLLLDTYEIVDRADAWVRLVIQEAGPRVVWALAGRDNLRDSRSANRFVGYSAEFPRQLFAMDLQELAIADIAEYLRYRAPHRPATDAEAARVHRATLGIPLALQEAADLWERGVPLDVIADESQGTADRDEIVRAMSERVLIHCNAPADQEDRRALFLLAMQRRSDPDVQRAALAPEEGSFDLEARWVELARRYSSVQRRRHVVLHAKMAAFLREYLLSPQQKGSEVVRDLATRAAAAARRRLDRIEEQLPLLEERCESENWQEAAIDYVHWLFWKDPVAAWDEWLPCFIASLGYSSELESGLFEAVGAFEPALSPDERKRLKLLRRSLTGDEEAIEKAIADCRGWLKRQPDSSPYVRERQAILDIEQGEALRQRKQWPRACELFSKAELDLPAEGQKLKRRLTESLVALAQDLTWAKGFSRAVYTPEAESSLRKVVDWFPGQAEAWNLLGILFIPAKRFEEAYASHLKAASLAPNNALYSTNVGIALFCLKRYDEATRCFQRALEIDSDDANAHNWLGKIHYDLKRYDEAALCLQRALEIDSNYASAHNGLGWVYYDLKRYDEAIRCYQRALEIDSNYASAHFGLGSVHYSLNNYDEAIRCFQRTLEIDPNEVIFYNWLGKALYDLKRYEEAALYLQRALDIDSNYTSAHYGLGRIHYDLNRYGEAALCLQRVLEIDSNYASAHYGLGRIYYRLNRHDEATQYFQRALEIDPNYASAHSWLACAAFGLAQYDRAVKASQRSTNLSPQSSEYWNNLGFFLAALGRTDEALVALGKAVDADSNFASPHKHLGKLHLFAGRLPEAIACLKQAVFLNPEYGSAHASLAFACRQTGRHIDSEKHLEIAARFIRLEDGDYNQACYEAIAGNPDGALALLRGVFDISPGYRLVAGRDPDFEALRTDPRFQDLIRRNVSGQAPLPDPSVAKDPSG